MRRARAEHNTKFPWCIGSDGAQPQVGTVTVSGLCAPPGGGSAPGSSKSLLLPLRFCPLAAACLLCPPVPQCHSVALIHLWVNVQTNILVFFSASHGKRQQSHRGSSPRKQGRALTQAFSWVCTATLLGKTTRLLPAMNDREVSLRALTNAWQERFQQPRQSFWHLLACGKRLQVIPSSICSPKKKSQK